MNDCFDYVEVYNINVENGMTKEEFNLAVDFCVKCLKGEVSLGLYRGICWDSEVMDAANLHLNNI